MKSYFLWDVYYKQPGMMKTNFLFLKISLSNNKTVFISVLFIVTILVIVKENIKPAASERPKKRQRDSPDEQRTRKKQSKVLLICCIEKCYLQQVCK